MRKVWVRYRKDRKKYFVYWWDRNRQYSKSLPTKKLADHFAHLKYTQLNSDVFVGQIDVPFDYLVNEYLNTYDLRGLKPASKIEARLTLNHFRRTIGQVSSKYINQPLVDRFIRVRMDRVASRWTVNKDISNLRAFLRWAAKQHYIGPGIKLAKLPTAQIKVRPLTDKQVSALLKSAGGPGIPSSWPVRIVIALCLGLRKGDIESIRIEDLHLDQASVDTTSKKTNKKMLDRPIPTEIIPILAEYLKTRPKIGKLLADTNTHKRWKQIRESAGLPNLRFQDLRVTFSSRMQAVGVSLSVVQQLLEHASPETTRRHYTNVDDQLKTAVNKLPVAAWLSSWHE